MWPIYGQLPAVLEKNEVVVVTGKSSGDVTKDRMGARQARGASELAICSCGMVVEVEY